MFKRYAVYYTPEPGTPLADFGAAWLGWDSANGRACQQPDIAGLDVAALTDTPRKYGFHGTIKPPFRLADGHTAEGLQEALAAFCTRSAPVTLEGLQLTRLGRFLALVPQGDASSLAQLAARAVQELDPFRAPLTEADLTKRRAARLTPAQDAHLVRWGYPYVLDQFRFHLTLSGKLDTPTIERAEAALALMPSQLDLAPYRLTGLTLLGEDDAGMFHQIHRYALTG
ncbi:DUF1045 domain-containing protein [Tateyamaria sp. ANG-S1]|uniref:DUF1045 domain-containing protein n=1 Tax=Tateyamaria sp. ANG-S1 TaxID=1577905 RepID=UPI00057D1987|nr:DUF1045 domain-containing protein [Tateyamaria sp. ANG-S1]KIC48181.1 phosphonate metabolism protein [Tateyamaria sp. ANG-S1]